MSVSERVLSEVKSLIEKHEMIASGDNVLVAVSGGADSVCLLSVLYALKDSLEITVCAAHLNHMIRGEEAERDEKFVKDLCASLGIRCFLKKTDVPELSKQEGISLEEAGRCARYDFFAELKEKENITKIATAHNMQDRAETVLMRIIRGTGLDGLYGISYKREDGVIRPLLDTKREDIEAYLDEIGRYYCEDSTNSCNDYTRNKIRNELIPYLKENFNPRILETLVRFSSAASEDAEFLKNYAQRLSERINSPLPSHKPYALHIETLKILENSIKARLVKIMAKKAAGYDLKLEYKHILSVLEMLDKSTGAAVSLPDGIRVKTEYGWLVFENTKEILKENQNKIEDEDLFIRVHPMESYYIENLSAEIAFSLVDPTIYKKRPNEQLLDFEKLEGKPLLLRTREKGDRMACFEDGREKKLKNIFIDSKIPKDSRGKIPLLCADGEIAAIVGLRVSEIYKINKNTRKALKIEYRKIKSND